MKNLVKDKSFVIGFLVGLLLWGLLNVFLANNEASFLGCDSTGQAKGFPFHYVEKCDNPTFMRFKLFGLVADAFTTIFVSGLIGFSFKFLSSKRLK